MVFFFVGFHGPFGLIEPSHGIYPIAINLFIVSNMFTVDEVAEFHFNFQSFFSIFMVRYVNYFD
jgi:hypothetical protein